MRCLQPPFQPGGKTIHRIPEVGAPPRIGAEVLLEQRCLRAAAGHLRGACRRSSSKAHQRPNQHRPGQGRQEQQNRNDAVNWAEPISNAVSSAL